MPAPPQGTTFQSNYSLLFIPKKSLKADSARVLYSDFEPDSGPMTETYSYATRVITDKADDSGEICDIATNVQQRQISLNDLLSSFGGMAGVNVDDVIIRFGEQMGGNVRVDWTVKFRKKDKNV